MLDFLLWNKIARIIAQLADTLHISTDRALQIFYDSDVCRMLHDKDLGLHLMSDTYIVNDLIAELRNKQQKNMDKGQFLLYQTPDGDSQIEVKLQNDTVWLSLDQMAELFQRNKSTISRHVKNVLEDGELEEKSVVAFFARV